MPRELEDYAAKRRLDSTPEPAAVDAPPREGPLLFVVQQHAARGRHYDLRLELDGVLKSWALPKEPSLNPADKRLAVETEDHPFDYATFEGVIPPGQYGAGKVIVWDAGVYSLDKDGPYLFHDRRDAQERIRAALAEGKLSLFLRGEKLKGAFALVRTKEAKAWLLIKHKDSFAGTTVEALGDKSILSARRVDDVGQFPAQGCLDAQRLTIHGPKEACPRELRPMLAGTADQPFTTPEWSFEPKLDGYRVIAQVENDEVRLQSRTGLDLNPAFPDIVADLKNQRVNSIVLDGELVALDAAGRPNFNALQNRAQLKAPRDLAAAERAAPGVLYCFDILHFAGIDLRQAPYEDRRRYLAQCLLPSTRLRLVPADSNGFALYKAAVESGFEGMVAKKKSSIYQPGRRSSDWLKVKAKRSAEFVIGGYTEGKGGRKSRFGALLVGYWGLEGQLVYAGRVGSGFDDAMLEQLKDRFLSLEASHCPFHERPPLQMPITWLTPQLVAEVEFAEWTSSGHLRHPVFLRLRPDVDAKSVSRLDEVHAGGSAPSPDAGLRNDIEAVLQQLSETSPTLSLSLGPERIILTNLDKVLWPQDEKLQQPATMKRDLLRYLARVAPYLLPHLANRPLTMIRMPDGINRERFFQKHWPENRPDFVETVRVFSKTKDENRDLLLCNNLATLLWLGQIGTLELHVWHSRIDTEPDARGSSTDFDSSLETLERSILNFPDYVVFDLDPYVYSGTESQGEEPALNVPAFEKAKEVAFWLKGLLEDMSLAGLVKTSGKTGLHVFVPIARTLDFEATRRVCEMVGRHLERQHPEDITMEWSVDKRAGKIFIDHNMNVRGKTLNVAYSPRGVAGAPVSMPLTWEELVTAHPLDFTIRNVCERLEQRHDVWRDLLCAKQSIERAVNRS